LGLLNKIRGGGAHAQGGGGGLSRQKQTNKLVNTFLHFMELLGFITVLTNDGDDSIIFWAT